MGRRLGWPDLGLLGGGMLRSALRSPRWLWTNFVTIRGGNSTEQVRNLLNSSRVFSFGPMRKLIVPKRPILRVSDGAMRTFRVRTFRSYRV